MSTAGTSNFGRAAPFLLFLRATVVILAGWPGWLLVSRSITGEFGRSLATVDRPALDMLTLGRAIAQGIEAFPGVALGSLAVALILDQMLAVAAVRASTPDTDSRVWTSLWREGPAWLVPLLKLALLGLVATGAVGALVHLGAGRLATYGQREGWTLLQGLQVRMGQTGLTGLLIAIVGAKVFWLRTAMLVSGRRALWRNLWNAHRWLWGSKGAILALGLSIWVLQLFGLALHATMRPGHANETSWALWGAWIFIGALVWLIAIRSSTRRYVAQYQTRTPATAPTEEPPAEQAVSDDEGWSGPDDLALPPEPVVSSTGEDEEPPPRTS